MVIHSLSYIRHVINAICDRNSLAKQKKRGDLRRDWDYLDVERKNRVEVFFSSDFVA